MRTSSVNTVATMSWARPQLSGHLQKLSSTSKRWRRRYLSLNGKQLLLFRSSPTGRPLSILDLGGARITASKQPVRRHDSDSSSDEGRDGGGSELLYVLRLALLPQPGDGSSSSSSGRQMQYKLAATSREMQGLWCDALSAAAASAEMQPPQPPSMRRPSARQSAVQTGLGAGEQSDHGAPPGGSSSSPAVRQSRASTGRQQQQQPARLSFEPRQSTGQRHRPSAAAAAGYSSKAAASPDMVGQADADDESESHLLQPRSSQLRSSRLDTPQQRLSVFQEQQPLSSNVPHRHCSAASRQALPLAVARSSLTAAAAQLRPSTRASLAASPQAQGGRISTSRPSGVMQQQQQVARPSQLAASRSSIRAAASSSLMGPDRQQCSSSDGRLDGHQPVYRSTLSSSDSSRGISDSATGSEGSSTSSGSDSYTGSGSSCSCSRSGSEGRTNTRGKQNTWGWGQWCCWLVSTLSTDGGSSSCDSDATMESWEVRESRRSSTHRVSTVASTRSSRRGRSSSDGVAEQQQQQQQRQQHRGSQGSARLSSRPSQHHRSASAAAAVEGAASSGGPQPQAAGGARLPSRSMVDTTQRFTSRSTPGGGIGRMRSSLPASWEVQQPKPSLLRSSQHQQQNNAQTSTGDILLELPVVSSSLSLAAWRQQQPQRRSVSATGLLTSMGQPRHSASSQQQGSSRVSRVSARQAAPAARASQAGNRQPQDVAASSMQDAWWQQEDEQQQQQWQQQQSQLEWEPVEASMGQHSEALRGSASGSNGGAAAPRSRSSSQQQQQVLEPEDVGLWGAGAAPSSGGGSRRSVSPQWQARVSSHVRTTQLSAAGQAGVWGSSAGAAASPSQSLAGGRLTAHHSQRGSFATAAGRLLPQQPEAASVPAAAAAEWWARRQSSDALGDAQPSLMTAESGSNTWQVCTSSASTGSAAAVAGGGLLTGATTSLSAYDDISWQLRQQQQQPVTDLRPVNQATRPVSIMPGSSGHVLPGARPAAVTSFVDGASAQPEAAAHQPLLVPSPPAVRAQPAAAAPRPPPLPPVLPPPGALQVKRAPPSGPPPALPLSASGSQQQSAALAAKAAEGLPAALAAAAPGREALLNAITSGTRLNHVHRASMAMAQQAGLLQ